MFKALKKDNSRRFLFSTTEFLRKLLNCLVVLKKRFIFFNSLIFKKLFFSTRIKNICWVSGRKRSVFRIFKVSRVVIKGVSLVGLLPGLRKVS